MPRAGNSAVPIGSLLVVLLALLFFSPALFFGRMPTFRDFINTFLPYRIYAAHAFASGRIPLWAPEPSLGAPLLANYQSGVLYPLSAVIDLFPNPFGVGLYLALHFALGGLGMNALLARRGLSGEARLLGAIVYMFGGVFISISAWSHLAVAAWIPLAIVAAEEVVGDPRPRRFLWLVALLTLQVLGGAPESFAQSAALVAAAALLAPGEMPRRRRLLLVSVAGGLAVSLCALQLLPTAEYFRQTTRSGGLPAEQAMKYSLQPKTLETLLVPHRIDGGLVAPMPETHIPLFWSVYVGLAPLALAGLGIFSRDGSRWTMAAAAALLLALGDHTPVFPFLYKTFPWFFGAFRYPEKFLLTAHLALALLAAVGASRLQKWITQGSRLPPRLVLAGFCLITVTDLFDVHLPAMLYSDWRSLVSSAPPVALAEAGADARIFHYTPSATGIEAWYPKFGVGQNLRDLEHALWANLGANVSLVYGIGFVNGADSFLVAEIGEFYQTLSGLPLDQGIHLLRGFAVRNLVGPIALDDPSIELVRRGNWQGAWIYRMRTPAPRVYLARRALQSATAHEAFERMASSSFVPGEDVALEGLGDRPLGGGRASLVESSAEKIAVDLESEGEGLLVVNDSFFPGWEADVDGVATTILRVNGRVRGVKVPSGSHRVTMRYRPDSFRIGLLISLASLIVALPVSRWVLR